MNKANSACQTSTVNDAGDPDAANTQRCPCDVLSNRGEIVLEVQNEHRCGVSEALLNQDSVLPS